MKYRIVIVLILASCYAHAFDTIHSIGTWMRNDERKLRTASICVSGVSALIESSAESFCSIPLHYQISDLAREIISTAESPTCNALYPIRALAPHVAAATLILPNIVISMAHLGKVPRSIRTTLTTNGLQSCCLGLALGYGNVYVETYLRWISRIDPSWIPCDACNVILPVYTHWAPCLSACCIALPPLLCCCAHIGNCCAGDADKED